MKPLISIIIPCYNASQHISRCFQSLENQSIGIGNLEIIFVNDASTDDTLTILQEFEKKHPQNVIIINCLENGRQGAARNIGLSYATADYIGFADDDDSFSEDMFLTMYQKAITYDCDMVMCGFENIGEQDAIPPSSSGTDTFFDITLPEERLAFITMDSIRCIWNKLYRRDIIFHNNIRFPEGYIYDDIYFYELIKHYTNRIYQCHQTFYYHIVHKTSASLDANRINDMIGYLDVQLMLLDELQNRNLFRQYQDSYTEMLLLEAIGLVKTYIIRYGSIEGALLKEIIIKLLPYREAMLHNQLLQPIYQSSSNHPDKTIAQVLLQIERSC